MKASNNKTIIHSKAVRPPWTAQLYIIRSRLSGL